MLPLTDIVASSSANHIPIVTGALLLSVLVLGWGLILRRPMLLKQDTALGDGLVLAWCFCAPLAYMGVRMSETWATPLTDPRLIQKISHIAFYWRMALASYLGLLLAACIVLLPVPKLLLLFEHATQNKQTLMILAMLMMLLAWLYP